MDGDNYDSFDDEKFTADEILEERYSRRKKMKEYLQKWRGYSSMNNGSKLEADLEYDMLVSDYSVQKKKKWKKKSKSQGWQSNASGSGRIGCAYTVPHDGPDGLVDGVKLDRCHTKGAKQSTSDALKENDDEHDSHWLKMLPPLGKSGTEKDWIPESIVSSLSSDSDFPPTYVARYLHNKKLERALSSICRTYWPDMVAGLYERHLDEESGTSSKKKPLL